jgi:hypothetical protein
MVRAEKGISMPEDDPTERRMKYPWLTMAVGESFPIETSLVAARTNARQASERYKKIYEARRYKGTVRIWRLK